MDPISNIVFLGTGDAMTSYWMARLNETATTSACHKHSVDADGNIYVPFSTTNVGGFMKLAPDGSIVYTRRMTYNLDTAPTNAVQGVIITPGNKALAMGYASVLNGDDTVPSFSFYRFALDGSLEFIGYKYYNSNNPLRTIQLNPTTGALNPATISNSSNVAVRYESHNPDSDVLAIAYRYIPTTAYANYDGGSYMLESNNQYFKSWSITTIGTTRYLACARALASDGSSITFRKQITLGTSTTSTCYGYARLSDDTMVQRINNSAYILKTDGTIKLMSQGTSFPGNGDVAADSGNSIYLLNYNDATPESFITKCNAAGTVDWTRGLTNTRLKSLCLVDDNTMVVSGAASNGQVFVAQLPTDGTKTGTYSVGGTNYVYASRSSSFGFTLAADPSFSNITNALVSAGSEALSDPKHTWAIGTTSSRSLTVL